MTTWRSEWSAQSLPCSTSKCAQGLSRKDEWALSLVLGLILFFRPAASALAVLLLFRAYAIIFGMLLLIFAFRLRSLIEVRQEV